MDVTHTDRRRKLGVVIGFDRFDDPIVREIDERGRIPSREETAEMTPRNGDFTLYCSGMERYQIGTYVRCGLTRGRTPDGYIECQQFEVATDVAARRAIGISGPSTSDKPATPQIGAILYDRRSRHLLVLGSWRNPIEVLGQDVNLQSHGGFGDGRFQDVDYVLAALPEGQDPQMQGATVGDFSGTFYDSILEAAASTATSQDRNLLEGKVAQALNRSPVGRALLVPIQTRLPANERD